LTSFGTAPPRLEEDDWYDPDRQRPPVAQNLAWILLLFVAVGWIAVFSGMQ
jgi:hypothetical protein